MEIVSTHELKCWPEFFEEVFEGRKRFEIRKDDRDFQPGDHLWLREYDPKQKLYTGRHIYASVGYLTYFEQKPGYVVFQLEQIIREQSLHHYGTVSK